MELEIEGEKGTEAAPQLPAEFRCGCRRHGDAFMWQPHRTTVPQGALEGRRSHCSPSPSAGTHVCRALVQAFQGCTAGCASRACVPLPGWRACLPTALALQAARAEALCSTGRQRGLPLPCNLPFARQGPGRAGAVRGEWVGVLLHRRSRSLVPLLWGCPMGQPRAGAQANSTQPSCVWLPTLLPAGPYPAARLPDPVSCLAGPAGVAGAAGLRWAAGAAAPKGAEAATRCVCLAVAAAKPASPRLDWPVPRCSSHPGRSSSSGPMRRAQAATRLPGPSVLRPCSLRSSSDAIRMQCWAGPPRRTAWSRCVRQAPVLGRGLPAS